MCQRALSVPRTNTSRGLDPHEGTAGPLVRTPPNDSHGCHDPFHHMCQRALSVPRTNTSILFELQEAELAPKIIWESFVF